MTAVEWLIQQICGEHTDAWKEEIIQAIEMEKQQIMEAFNAGVNSEDFFCPPFEISESEQYYNETYKKP
jgi:predicted secreted protein